MLNKSLILKTTATSAVLVTILISGFSSLAAPPLKAKVRFIHAIPGETDINVRLDYGNIARNVRYGNGTKFKSVLAGNYLMDLTTAKGLTTIIPPSPQMFAAGTEYTVLAAGSVSGNPPLQTRLIPMPDVTPAQSRVLLINALPDSFAPVEILLNGAVVAPALFFAESQAPFEAAAGNYTIEVRIAGTTVLGPSFTKLKSKKTHTFVVQGTTDPADGLPLQLKLLTSN